MSEKIPNPFKPSAGSRPPLLIGRQTQIDDFAEGLDNGPGAPDRLSFFDGARGVGKTAMLSEVSDAARERGWLVVNDTVSENLSSRIMSQLDKHLYDRSAPARRKISQVTLPVTGGGFSLAPREGGEPVGGMRQRIERLLDALEADQSGLLFAIDESRNTPDFREFAVVMQQLISDRREVAIAMAGLPSSVSDVLSGRDGENVLTFLRRAERPHLGAVDVNDVADSFVETVTDNGRRIDEDVAMAAAQVTGGYPFMIQLVGYHAWRSSGDSVRIDHDDVEKATLAARARIGSLVHAPALRDLSAQDKTFLLAMAQSDGPSQVSDIRALCGFSSAQHANVYRERLIASGLVAQAGHGQLDFVIPYLREHLREHSASSWMGDMSLPVVRTGGVRAKRSPSGRFCGARTAAGAPCQNPAGACPHHPQGR